MFPSFIFCKNLLLFWWDVKILYGTTTGTTIAIMSKYNISSWIIITIFISFLVFAMVIIAVVGYNKRNIYIIYMSHFMASGLCSSIFEDNLIFIILFSVLYMFCFLYSIIQIITNLQNIQNLEDDLSLDIEQGLVRECSICLNTETNNFVKISNCEHIFHHHCIIKWLEINRQCPLCRISTNVR